MKKDLSWKITIKRKSQFNAWIDHEILEIENKLIWAWAWVREKLHLMDTRKKDIIRSILNDNRKNVRVDKEWSREMAKEVSKLFTDININV